MLKQRIFTAIFLVVLLLGLLFSLSPLAFSLVITPVILLAGWEWTNLMEMHSKTHKYGFVIGLLLVLTFLGSVVGLGDSVQRDIAEYVLLLDVVIWVCIFFLIFTYPLGARFWSNGRVLYSLGILLLSFTWIAIVYIQSLPSGNILLLVAFGIVALSDVGGFIFGKLFGRHKLAPRISPGKTWEGFLGAMILEFVLVIGLILLREEELPVLPLFLVVLVVAISSVGGDLFESMVKRNVGAKDSGGILPGHGGILDRIDGMMSALPIYAVLLTFLKIV